MLKFKILLLSIVSGVTSAYGAITISIEQSGSDLHISTSGTYTVSPNQADVPLFGLVGQFLPTGFSNKNEIISLATGGSTGLYTGSITGTVPPLPDVSYNVTGVTGTTFGYVKDNNFNFGAIYGPVGFTPGTISSGFGVVQNATLADIGLTPSSSGSFSVGAQPVSWAVVPEPSTYVLACSSLALGFAFLRRKKR
ncbi:PEP-CTERM sorting domain-containing protein [Puniceicoccales bacterium CK1056]|uniref:PEP-CTERM sorting domain-containing protein n=1 Tax=Oceanipulchritudo coccoides TaxID=2706888 RepID=A0A6B2M3X3_9BACT|nr:PEP-CTERM sorting domain-containing protein [Oceanipulchritudo coccoides]NDV62919.1 PEP-CTERM sorting domain-containing protein [Oceanipulchritudo coccoides]